MIAATMRLRFVPLVLLLACRQVPVLLTAVTTLGLSTCSAFAIATPTTFNHVTITSKRSIANQVERKRLWPSSPATWTTLFAGTTGSGNGNGSGPEKWTSMTSPFVAVRYYSRDDVSDEEIQKLLKQNLITAMDDLLDVDKYKALSPVVRKSEFFYFFPNALMKACQKRKISVEDALGGKFVLEESLIPPKNFDMYAPAAVSVKPEMLGPYKADERPPEISLVMGSSGSGKTLFALRGLPAILLGNEESKAVLSLHFRAEDAVARVKSKISNSFPEAVAAVVQDMIASKLASVPMVDEDAEVASLFLHVVIDEAGAEGFEQFFNTADKLRAVCSAIKATVKPRFERGVRVTVAGTGIEPFTAGIVSVIEANKFRMQPWTADNFDALVDKSDYMHAALTKEVVHSFPILEDLSSNARCAYFLLRAMGDVSVLRKHRRKNFVRNVISAVAESYIKSNVLAKLDTVGKKWQVVRAVFRELDRATCHKDDAFFPQFNDLPDEALRAASRSLLDVNVETTSGIPKFVQANQYSFSMSPAVVIALVNLLCSDDVEVSWDWQSFETMLMLSELKQVVVPTKGIPDNVDRLIVQLQAPFPAANTKGKFSVPLVGARTVVINRAKSSYADVIAPYRLALAKFSMYDDNQSARLDLQEELDKMGVTIAPDKRLQQDITKILHYMWKNDSASKSLAVVSSAPQNVNKKYRFHCYPINTLNSRRVNEQPRFVEGTFENNKLTVKGEGITEGDAMPENFEASNPLVVVFATNCKEFQLVLKNYKVRPDQVDCKGKLLVPLPTDFVTGLRKNVEIRFQFF